MWAYRLHGVGDIKYEECKEPELQDGWCIVQVKACGICSSDIPRIFTRGTYHFPTIPGHEFSGIVSAVSGPVDNSWLGKRVGVFPLIPCKKCKQCRVRHYEMCDHYDYIGSRRDGAFAEYVAVPTWNLIELPRQLSFVDGAILEPLSVALHATKRASIHSNQKVAVVGTGIIAFAAAQYAKLYGAEVTIIARNNKKESIAKKVNVHYLVCESSSAVEDKNEDYDVVIEAVGSSESVGMAISLAAKGGSVVLVGNPSSNLQLDQNAYWEILRKQLVLHGSWNSSFKSWEHSDWADTIEALETKQIKAEELITHTFPSEQLLHALSLMKQHTEPYCKVMTIWNE